VPACYFCTAKLQLRMAQRFPLALFKRQRQFVWLGKRGAVANPAVRGIFVHPPAVSVAPAVDLALFHAGSVVLCRIPAFPPPQHFRTVLAVTGVTGINTEDKHLQHQQHAPRHTSIMTTTSRLSQTIKGRFTSPIVNTLWQCVILYGRYSLSLGLSVALG